MITMETPSLATVCKLIPPILALSLVGEKEKAAMTQLSVKIKSKNCQRLHYKVSKNPCILTNKKVSMGVVYKHIPES